ncbi:uncharacterized protein RCC_00441 [Ramularia collo-cygni]|uniref:PAS domain-containing protein n=1 Tax=Ramularia collo-cygni TaxID=112498 RepID=A0A2D3UWM6_9PEZI|nr:uncharacterized protein RCC_00441 [Ramularia collo-cygni]CZT14464.1 uncharacterized protein RCC_00441 [Ramularia collo-cygni]
MDSSDVSSPRSNSRPSHKLYHKFAPFRKRQLREVRSEENITVAESLPSMNEVVDSAHPSPKSKYSQGAVDRSTATNSNAESDDFSLRLGARSDDDKDRPRTPVSPADFPMPVFTKPATSESPTGGRHGNGGRRPSHQSVETYQIGSQNRGRQPSYQSTEGSQVRTQNSGFLKTHPSPTSLAVQDSRRSERSPAQPQVASRTSSNPPRSDTSTRGPKKIGPEALAQLQTPSADKSDVLHTKLILADDPESWDVINPNMLTAEDWDRDLYSLEKRAEQLYSPAHLHIILEDPEFHFRFSAFLRQCRPWRLPLLEFYWRTRKAIKALEYANSLTQNLSDKPRLETSRGIIEPPGKAANIRLHEAANAAFEELLGDDLHWYIANIYINIVGSVMQSRITGTLPVALRESSQGLAEVFCITDPSRKDNPIILASQAFMRHSGHNLDYILGRNCRFMQGPGTTVDSCRRFAIAVKENRDHSEIFVNYRRDGSPFLSLVMNALLVDSQDNLRYYLGAQVDVSGLLKSCAGLQSLTKLVEQENSQSDGKSHSALKSLSEMLSADELEVIAKHGGSLQKGAEHELQHPAASMRYDELQRVLIADGSDESDQGESFPSQGTSQRQEVSETIPTQPIPQVINLSGVYKYYLIVRPAPSLRILFASPTLRSPGILQSNFLNRIGGSRMRNDLGSAFQQPEVVTAKVRWLDQVSSDGEGNASMRWIHCTPLMHHSGAIGLWMIVMVMPEKKKETTPVWSERTSSRAVNRSEERTGRREVRPGPRYIPQV